MDRDTIQALFTIAEERFKAGDFDAVTKLRAAAERIRVLGELATRWYQPDGTFIVLPEEEVIAKRKHAALMLRVLGEECEKGRNFIKTHQSPEDKDRAWNEYNDARAATDAARGGTR